LCVERSKVTTEERLAEFLRVLSKTSKNGLILGGPDLQLKPLLEKHLRGRRLVFWDPASEEDLEGLLVSSFWPGCSACLLLDERAGVNVFRVLEEVLSEGCLTVAGLPRHAPEGWQLLVHAPPGHLPFSSLFSYQLRI